MQPGFLAPEHVHVTMEVAWDQHNTTGRYQIQVHDPTTRELIALRSRPFQRESTLQETLQGAYTWLNDALVTLGLCDPF